MQTQLGEIRISSLGTLGYGPGVKSVGRVDVCIDDVIVRPVGLN